MTEIGRRIWEAAKARGFESQADLARRLEVHRQQINKWLYRDQDLSGQTALKIARVLRINVVWLLTGAGNMAGAAMLDEDAQRLLAIYDMLPPEWRTYWISDGERLLDRLGLRKK